jgi:hypothetical protein
MKRLMVVRRCLFLTVAALPIFQTTGCTLSPTIIENAFVSQISVLVNQLVASLFDFALTRAFG